MNSNLNPLNKTQFPTPVVSVSSRVVPHSYIYPGDEWADDRPLPNLHEYLFLSIPTEDELVAFQRYVNIASHMIGTTVYYKVLNGKRFGIMRGVHVAQLSCISEADGSGTIWELSLPMSWFVDHAGAVTVMKLSDEQFLSDFFEFVEDYAES